jgi:hypothetical protein
MWGKDCKLEERKIEHGIPWLHIKSIHKIRKMQFNIPYLVIKGLKFLKNSEKNSLSLNEDWNLH